MCLCHNYKTWSTCCSTKTYNGAPVGGPPLKWLRKNPSLQPRFYVSSAQYCVVMDTRRLGWLLGLLPDDLFGAFVDGGIGYVESPSAQMCLSCRAAKMLCGRPRCPILVKAGELAKRAASYRAVGPSFSGHSPPGVFVGRLGYPKVYVGPLVSAKPDPWVFDHPETWVNMDVDTIVGFRLELLRGMRPHSVFEASDPSERLIRIQDLALSSRPVATELDLERPPRLSLSLSDEAAPMGPSATYSELRSWGSRSDRRIEKAYYDTDLNASMAVVSLYNSGVEVSRIQKAFSVGMVGVGSKRRLVPTRWSITAVDTILGEALMGRVKEQPSVDDTLVFTMEHLGSTYVGYVFPGEWAYEWVEAWQPRTVWNASGVSPELTGDYEDHRGRSTYAEPGGCYYAARLAAAEALMNMHRKGTVVLLREIHSGYMMPLGVWSVREAVRAMFRQKPERFSDVRLAVDYGVSKTGVPLGNWLVKARLLDQVLHQRRITEFTGAL